MKYFKNTELARLYHVSEKSVRNWIQATRDGKLDLQLYDQDGRFFVANISENIGKIDGLVEKGRKYKNTRGIKTLTPKKEFYEVYSYKQILDILSSITIHNETPLQYGYVNGGAEDWDRYSKRLYNDRLPNLLTTTIKLIDITANNVDHYLNGYKKVNIVNLGPNNGLVLRPTIERLLRQGMLGRCIGIDISKDMLNIAKKNVKSWFGNSVKFEAHVRDMSYERFADVLADDFANADTANLVFLLEGTLANFRAPEQVLQTINNSLGPNDLLLCGGYLDTPATRRYFDYRTSLSQKVPVQDGLILDFLNIDEALYDVEQLFDEKEQARSISVRPKLDLYIRLELLHGTRHIELRKNQPILLWRHRHYSFPDLVGLFDRNGFNNVLTTSSNDQDYFLLISKIKTSSPSR